MNSRSAPPPRGPWYLTIQAALVALYSIVAGLLGCGEPAHESSGRSRAQPLPEIESLLRGHKEMAKGPGGRAVAWLLDADPTLDLCLRTSSDTPTSLWQAQLWLEDTDGTAPARETDFTEPTSRLGTTLCFTATIPDHTTPRPLELCARIRDRWDGSEMSLPCHSILVGHDDGRRQRLESKLHEILQSPPEGGLEPLADALDALADEARDDALPFLAVRVELVAVHFLRQQGSADALAKAAERLARPPAWLEAPVATGWRIKWEYELALLALARRWDLRSAWQHLAVADELSAWVLHPTRLTLRMKQAEILARVGAVEEATRRLATALEDCATMPCRERLVPSAQGVLGWLLILDPLAGPTDLEQARTYLGSALDGARGDPLEVANQQINLAYLELRRADITGDDQTPPTAMAEALTAARNALGSAGRKGARFHLLTGWAHLLEGLGQLGAGRWEGALVSCAEARRTGLPRLAAWAAECEGRAHRWAGSLDEARHAFASAVLLHQYATPERLGQSMALGPSRRAETFYRAARLEVDRGDAAAAWTLLSRLDRLAEAGAALPTCRGSGNDPETAESTRRRDDLLAALARLEGPASGLERRQRASTQRRLSEQLEELVRQWPSCAGDTGASPAQADESTQRAHPSLLPHPPTDDDALSTRIFAVDDEVVILHRGPAPSAVELLARRPWGRRERSRTLAHLERAMGDRGLDDPAWRSAFAEAARALAVDLLAKTPGPSTPPRAETPDLPPVLSVALHGELQRLPLAALPLAGGGWLGDRRTPAIWPGAGLPSTKGPPAGFEPSQPLLVVDPKGDLPAGRALVDHYRSLFPEADLLLGATADREAFRAALPRARWLHVDTHGRYDPAFPELTSLVLADGPLTLAELAELPSHLELANLGACRVGQGPITADSGRFGLAGHLARHSARWVIAARSDLDDRLAGHYNRVFYQHLAPGESPPQAHARAMAEVRKLYPAATWSSLFLLHGRRETSPRMGKKGRLPTPSMGEGEARRGAPRGDTPHQEARSASTGETR